MVKESASKKQMFWVRTLHGVTTMIPHLTRILIGSKLRTRDCLNKILIRFSYDFCTILMLIRLKLECVNHECQRKPSFSQEG